MGMRVSKEQEAACLALAVDRPERQPAKPARRRKAVEYVTPMSAVSPDGGILLLRLPVHVKSEANISDGHWHARHARVKARRAEVAVLLAFHKADLAPFAAHYAGGGTLKVEFGRLGGRRLDELANLGRAFKSTEDELAETLGANDGDPRWQATAVQSPGGPVGITIRIEKA